MRPEKIVSGGQTGADRGGLDAALELDLPHGGWCTKGRRAEDGPIPARYELRETPSRDYAQRTEWNVRDSDATVVFTHGPPTGGSKLTVELARKHGRPCLPIDLDATDEGAAAATLRDFLAEHRPEVLNVAGSRGSTSPELREEVRRVLVRALSRRHEV